MEAFLASSVQESLSLYLYDNARFLCERLMAAAPTEQNAFLLATCYKHCNMTYRAYRLLRGCQSGPSRYLFAVCCIELGKHPEAEEALLKFGELQVPNGAAGFFLLGRICKLCGGRTKDAANHFTKALRLNPMLWSAFEELCSLGEDHLAAEFTHPATPTSDPTHPSNPFSFSFPTPHTAEAMDLGTSSFSPASQSGSGAAGGGFSPASHSGTTTTIPTGFTPVTASPAKIPSGLPSLDSTTTANQGGFSTAWPPGSSAPPSSSTFLTPTPTAAAAPPPVVKRTEGAIPFPGFSAGPSTPGHLRTPTMGQRHKVVEDGKLRKVSGRLFNEQSPVRRSARLAATHSGGSKSHPHTPSGGASSMSPDTTSSGHFTFSALPGSGSPPGLAGATSRGSGGVSGSRGGDSHDEEESEGGGAVMAEGQMAAHQMLAPLLEGFRHLSMFRCHEALEAFKLAPPQQYNTGWVLCQVARAYYEMSDYTQAVAAFEAARKVDPFRVENMEIYSTALWHLKRETDLAYLAHEMKDIDRLAPQTWCVLGNCLSLQKEHEAAVQLFQRALQLQPTFAYAYTLAGHEYYQNEDFEKAISCYRSAFRLEPRHYNALFGIGNINFKREQYEVARTNFGMALEIYPNNSVLKCYIGIACHKLRLYDEALELVQEAIDLEPNNKVARFEKAAVLTSMERLQEALHELHILQDMAPKEVNVHFQLGKLYKRVGQVDRALQHFNMALDLQPNSADVSSIKSAIEKIDISDDNEQEEL